MYCPSCGVNNTSVQKFCRSCGLNLEASSASVLEQLPNAESARLLRRLKKIERFGDFVWNTFALVIILAVGALAYHLYTGVQIWWEGFLFAFIITGFMAIGHGIMARAFERKRRNANSRMAAEIAEKSEPARLEDFHTIDSVDGRTITTNELMFREETTKELR